MSLVYSKNHPSVTLHVPGLPPRFHIAIRQGVGKVEHPTAITHAMTRDDLTVQLEPGEEGLVFGIEAKATVLMPDGSAYEYQPPSEGEPLITCSSCGKGFMGPMAMALRGKHMKRDHGAD